MINSRQIGKPKLFFTNEWLLFGLKRHIQMTKTKKMLFIGHAYHLKTKSSFFIIDLLKTKYDIDFFFFDPQKDDDGAYAKLKKKSYDVLVIWQVMPSLKKLQKYVRFQKSVYFPMYDYYRAWGLSHPNWPEYRQTQIICFSKIMESELRSAGFSTRYIQYFPKPAVVDSWGDKHKVFFWQRTEDITIEAVLTLLAKTDIRSIHMHKAIDPGFRFFIPPEEWLDKTTYSVWFETKDEMRRCVETATFFIAPRLYEGIGMTMLEAMACGRCVIAPNLSTANEYIVDGYTGYLYDPQNPQPIDTKKAEQIQKQAYEYICLGYKKWEEEKYRILDWIEEPVVLQCSEDICLKQVLPPQWYQKTIIPGIYSRDKKNRKTFYICHLPLFQIKINNRQTKKTYSLFKTIPLLRIKQNMSRTKTTYLLFNILPLLQIKTKRTFE